MNPTQQNREAIQQMLDASASDLAADDQSELLEQLVLSGAQGPQSIRSATGEEIINRPLRDLIEAEAFLSAKAAAVDPFGCMARKIAIPPGCA